MKTINLGILAHVDAGKTSVTEGLLYKSGVIKEIGRVDNGTTITDSMDLEKDRGITIKSSTVSFNYGDTKINIIDTPGHMDFIAEVERIIRVLDGAILVISAKEGVQVQTKVIFNTLVKLKIPTLIFINKIDRDGVSLEDVYRQVGERLTSNIINMQSVRINGKNDYEIIGIDEDEGLIEAMVEKLLNLDESLGEKFLNDEEIQENEYKESFLEQVKNCDLYPVFYGSALKNIGIEKLLTGLVACLPNNGVKEKEDLSAYVYKIDRDGKSKKMTYLRVFSGKLKNRQEVSVNGTDAMVKIKKLESVLNGEKITVNEVCAGDIAIVINDDSLKIGDFVGKRYEGIPDVKMAEPSLTASIEPVYPEDRSRLIEGLFQLTEEDPFLDCEINSGTDEIVLKLFGDIQMEVIESMLKVRYEIEAKFGNLRTIYRERPRKSFEKTIHIEVAPNPYWATIGLLIEPMPIGSGISYESRVSYGYLNNSFQQAVKDGVIQACKEGLLGWEITDLKVTFTHGLYYSPVSTPSDFRNLTPYVFWEALRNVGTEILEPYLKYTVQVPNDLCGRVMSDLNKMRATIDELQTHAEETILTGKVPVNTSKSYQSELISYSNGLGIFITEPYGYDVCGDGGEENKIRTRDINRDGLRFMFQKQSEE